MSHIVNYATSQYLESIITMLGLMALLYIVSFSQICHEDTASSSNYAILHNSLMKLRFSYYLIIYINTFKLLQFWQTSLPLCNILYIAFGQGPNDCRKTYHEHNCFLLSVYWFTNSTRG